MLGSGWVFASSEQVMYGYEHTYFIAGYTNHKKTRLDFYYDRIPQNAIFFILLFVIRIILPNHGDQVVTLFVVAHTQLFVVCTSREAAHQNSARLKSCWIEAESRQKVVKIGGASINFVSLTQFTAAYGFGAYGLTQNTNCLGSFFLIQNKIAQLTFNILILCF